MLGKHDQSLSCSLYWRRNQTVFVAERLSGSLGSGGNDPEFPIGINPPGGIGWWSRNFPGRMRKCEAIDLQVRGGLLDDPQHGVISIPIGSHDLQQPFRGPVIFEVDKLSPEHVRSPLLNPNMRLVSGIADESKQN